MFIFLLPMLVSGFTHTYYPMPEYKFSWTADLTTSQLHVEIVLSPSIGKEFGWVGFGIAGGSGGMLGSDVFTAYSTGGASCAIQDRRSSNSMKSLPREDISSEDGFADWQLDYCSLNGTSFTVAARRAFTTFDMYDLDFVPGPMTLIFAWSKTQPQLPTDLSYHDGGHAPKEVSLWGPAVMPFDPQTQLESDYDAVELTMPNVPIGNQTTYTCFGFNLTLKEGNATQAIAFEAIIEAANVDYVHHMGLFVCTVPLPSGPFECVTMPPSCQSGVLYAWGKGGTPFVLPKIAGFDIGIPSRTFVALQMHYNNMDDAQNLTDSSGVKIYRTNQKRENRTALLIIGSLKLNLTYGRTQIGVAGSCTANQTMAYNTTGMHMYAQMFHAHQRGRRLWTNLFRNGTFITTVGNNQAYDFNLQKTISLQPVVTLVPGDQLITYCVWDTSKDTKNVLYGETTADEMCINIVAFYPAFDTRAHITCGVNTNPFQATNPGRDSCVLLPGHPPAAYNFKNWTISDYYFLAGGNATCAPGFEGTAELTCPGYGAPFSFAGCRRKKASNATNTNSTVNETFAPTLMPAASSAFLSSVTFISACLLFFA